MRANPSSSLTLQAACHYGKLVLASQSEESARDTEILLQFVLQVSRTYLYAHSEQYLSPEQQTHFLKLLDQRLQGKPIAHLIGQRSFWTFELTITPDTLIPRPETELLVEGLLALIKPHPSRTVLDLGTGSGAIALALASERPHWHITACDQSVPALQVAYKNACDLKLSVHFIHSNWFEALAQDKFDIIAANPPYIAAEDSHLQQGDLRFEPLSALVSGQDGLADLRQIIQAAYAHLNSEGLLIVEHGFDQGEAVASLFQQHGYDDIHSWQDVQGHSRVCSGRRFRN